MIPMKTNEIDAAASSSPVSLQDNAEGVKLLPCPFCGATPDINNPATFQDSQGTKWGAVVCCCTGPEVRTGYDPVEEWRDDAIEAWNTRVSSPVPSVDVGGDGNRLPQPTASGAAAVWQPIGSAPKDGTRILAVEDFKRVSMDEDGNVTREHPEDMEVVSWSQKMGAWIGYGMALVSFEPTRWMSLPALTASPAGDDPEDGLPRSVASPAEPSWLTRCCRCTRLVDKREREDGGDPFGCELNDGRWTCSFECWDAEVRPYDDVPQAFGAGAHSSSSSSSSPEVETRQDCLETMAFSHFVNKTKVERELKAAEVALSSLRSLQAVEAPKPLSGPSYNVGCTQDHLPAAERKRLVVLDADEFEAFVARSIALAEGGARG